MADPTVSAPRRRVPRGAIVALVLLAALAVGYWLTRPEEGFVVGIHPLSDDEALVLVRMNPENGPSRGWILRARAGAEPAWTTELPDTPDGVGAAHGVATDGEVVVVVVGGVFGDGSVVALDAATGRIRWTRPQSGRSSMRPILRDGEAVLAYQRDGGAEVIALSLADGTPAWTHRAATSFGVAISDERATRLAYRDVTWRVVPLDEGAQDRAGWRIEVFGDACLTDPTLRMIEDGHLVLASLEGDPPSIERRPLSPAEPLLSRAETCGRRGEDLVFLASEASTEMNPPLHVVLVAPSGEIRSRVGLGRVSLSSMGGEPDRHEPTSHPLRGVVSDFVPVIVTSGERTFELVVIDLVRGAIAWRSAAREELLHHQVVRGVGGVHYLSRDGDIVAIDGSNGHVLAAVRTSIDGIRGSYATEHRLWGAAFDWADHPELPWVALDARTLGRVAGPHDELPTREDTTAAVIDWLEVPEAFRP